MHAGGDATGAEVHRVLSGALPEVERVAGAAVALTTALGPRGRQVTGAVVRTADGDVLVRSRATVLATGGLGHAYARTTNPEGVDGSGLALALSAGATLTDLEFVQFHPTALATGATRGRLPLVSEAVRGEGAVLRDHEGRRFMVGRHPLADLAPRDVVAREITRVAAAADAPYVWLDARPLGASLAHRFPTFVQSCAGLGLDPAVDLVPVTPAEHYLCGGVATDRWGATDLPGLYAVGEVAATGVHGANRLASNSLLEGLVFGQRLADRLVNLMVEGFDSPVDAGALNPNAEINQSDKTWDWDSRVSASYFFPGDVNVSANFEHRSGDAFARQVRFEGGETIPEIELNVEPIGTRRFPHRPRPEPARREGTSSFPGTTRSACA